MTLLVAPVEMSYLYSEKMEAMMRFQAGGNMATGHYQPAQIMDH